MIVKEKRYIELYIILYKLTKLWYLIFQLSWKKISYDFVQTINNKEKYIKKKTNNHNKDMDSISNIIKY